MEQIAPLSTAAFHGGPALALSAGGLALLAALMLAPGPETRAVAAIVPPWQVGGLTRAASLGLPVIDLRAGGRILLLDISDDPGAQDRLAGQGLILIRADRAQGCLADLPPALTNPERVR